MDQTLLLQLCIIALCVAFAIYVFARSSKVEDGPPPPPRQWKGGKITPVMAGPRNSVKERISRGSVMSQAVLLALEMARADGEVSDAELSHIHDFIRNYVIEADDSFTELVVKRGLAEERTDEAVNHAVETINAVASEEQRRIVVHLLIYVAKADGLTDSECAFLQDIGQRLGLSGAGLDELLGAADPPSYIQDAGVWKEDSET